ncbi:hypothetical protein [Nonomuraea sp. B1E8]|uniref:hypothetical protein n=1 Tax=unclassified Nonomuraea TaxID=2593643 RepID=UPI00325E1DD1
MQLAHVSITPEARAAVRSQLGTLFTDPPTLDGGGWRTGRPGSRSRDQSALGGSGGLR